MVYEWKIPNLYPVSPQVAGEEIESIRTAKGKDFIEAADLLEASRAENAPLHPCFEWDDDIAAEKYRLEQARKIIGNIITVQVTPCTSDSHTAVRAFVSVTPDKTKAQYTSINVALNNPDYRKTVLQNILGKLREIQRTYKDFEELSEVFKAIDDFAESLNK